MRRQDRNSPPSDGFSLARCREILEVSPGAGPREIKKAFRHLAFVWHPDRFPTGDSRVRKRAEERFKKLNAAYQTLMAASAAPRGPSTFDPAQAQQPGERRDTAAPADPVRRPVRVAVCLSLLLVLCAGAAVVGYRYLQLERAHREVRARLEISEGKKEALLALAANRPQHQAGVPTAEPPDPVSTASTAAGGQPVPRPPPAPPAGRTHRSDPLPEPDAAENKRVAIAALMVSAEALTDEGRYAEARDRYRAALSQIAAARHTGASFDDLERQIEQALGKEEIRLGAAGYRHYEGRWFSPEDYRTLFVHYRKGRVHYTALRAAAERFADPLVRSHLRAVFPSRLIHKNKVTCTDLRLLDNRPSAARFQLRYSWEVWTFDGVEEGKLTLELVYHPREDQWEAVWLTKRTSSEDRAGMPPKDPAARGQGP